ncbi:MAG: TlpA family protein disulfide reductase [Lachnospiraceae bacterium]|nr:TlpA family protein disulfide reductase [Lachnospiraceae bacterium]
MKKYTAIIVATVLTASMLTGCGMLDEILEDDPSDVVGIIDEDDEETDSEPDILTEEYDEDTFDSSYDAVIDSVMGAGFSDSYTPAQNDDDGSGQDPAAGTSGTQAASNVPSGSGDPIAFTTRTLDGERVTEDIFSNYDITIVHIWGTYCGPCISEMPDYAGAYPELPDNVNLIAVVCDVYEDDTAGAAYAQQILDGAGAGFTNLCLNDELAYLIYNIQYVPSSFFVDKEGRMIGGILDGADFNMTMKQLDSYLK